MNAEQRTSSSSWWGQCNSVKTNAEMKERSMLQRTRIHLYMVTVIPSAASTGSLSPEVNAHCQLVSQTAATLNWRLSKFAAVHLFENAVLLSLPFPSPPLPSPPLPSLPLPSPPLPLPFPSLPFPSLPFPSLPFPSLPFPSLPFPSPLHWAIVNMFPVKQSNLTN